MNEMLNEMKHDMGLTMGECVKGNYKWERKKENSPCQSVNCPSRTSTKESEDQFDVAQLLNN